MQEIARVIAVIEQLLPPIHKNRQQRRRTQLREMFLRWSPARRDTDLLLGFIAF
jgi:hypothetical protein